MPVLDHPVHPLTVASDHYGCHDRPEFRPDYFAPHRQYVGSHGEFFTDLRRITNRMSTECRYVISLTDPRCAEFKHAGSGEAFSAHIKERANQ